MARVLIAGCGYVGTVAGDLFHARGWEVEGWTHSAESAARLAKKLYRVRAADISARKQIATNRSCFDAVVQCASTRGGNADEYRRIYHDGARNLLEVLEPPTFLFTSSTSVYAQTDGSWVAEESEAAPKRDTAIVLRQTENLVLERGGIILRLAGIYGPGRSFLLRKFLAGEAKIEDDGARYINQVHRDDIAAAIVLLVTLSLTNALRNIALKQSKIFNVVDNEPLTQHDCYQWLAGRFGRPMPPHSAISEKRKRGATNKRVSNAKLRATGWEPKYPRFQDGIEQSVLPVFDRLGA
jgi:nucleoside-diphosphate-sugar epimerase